MLQGNGYLRPAVYQILGVVLLVGFALFWAITGQESALLVGAALTLIGVGSATGAIVTVKHEIDKQVQKGVDRAADEAATKPDEKAGR